MEQHIELQGQPCVRRGSVLLSAHVHSPNQQVRLIDANDLVRRRLRVVQRDVAFRDLERGAGSNRRFAKRARGRQIIEECAGHVKSLSRTAAARAY